MKHPLMKCGHLGIATDSKTNKPVCPICVGIDPNAEILANDYPDLTGRQAKCPHCGRLTDSDVDTLPFFEHCPTRKYDSYYCGCYGWD